MRRLTHDPMLWLGAAAVLITLACAVIPAFAGTITVDLGGAPLVIQTTGDHDFALAAQLAATNQQMLAQRGGDPHSYRVYPAYADGTNTQALWIGCPE